MDVSVQREGSRKVPRSNQTRIDDQSVTQRYIRKRTECCHETTKELYA
jgi:hypothetical protein